ncbi:RmlC-like cupin domain-containing protein [Biscogniauxia marginata]|nr:RmlC-like cupin domain-containing protein [Biscogniauxia marginata]
MLKSATITAVLAFCAVCSAAPQFATTSPSSSPAAPTETSSSSSATTATSTSTPTSPPPSGALAGLSKTQQILLSDLRVDALNDVLKDDADFVFDFGAARKSGPGEGGEIVQANRKTFPALTGSGVGMAVGFLGPCGFNTPHVHNRATELLVVTKGTVVSEMILENGAVAAAADDDGKSGPRSVTNTIAELQATPFYPGSLHSQFNPSCDDAVFVAPFSSDDPGVETMAQAYLALGVDTVRAAAGNQIDGADVDRFRGLLSENVALGVEECLRTCGIEKRK